MRKCRSYWLWPKIVPKKILLTELNFHINTLRFILRPGILEQSCVVSLGKLGNHYGIPLIRETLHIYAELSPELAQTSSIICPLLSYMMFNFFFHSHRSIYDIYNNNNNNNNNNSWITSCTKNSARCSLASE